MALAGKIALITGGSKGIGAALATRLTELGASVAVNYSSDSKAADDLVATLNGKYNTGCFGIKANAGSVEGVDEMVQAVVAKYGKIDILVANAGILPMKTLANTTEEDFDKIFALNVKGPYFLVQKAVPHMKAGGRVILFSTTQCSASTVAPAYLLYNSTKGAVEQMTRVMAKDLGTKGITVNAVAPGPTATDLFQRNQTPESMAMIAKMNPFNKIGDPEDVADAIALLCGGDARWINGQIVRLNGGMAV